jgi:tryptophan synthase alpha chain
MQPHETITAAVTAARKQGRPAMVAFLTAGYPRREDFGPQLTALSEAADVVEIGVPFTDPMADGLTIQRASQAALAAGVTLEWILEEIGRLRPAAPLILMSYLNPLLAFGFARLADRALRAGVAGFIVPDLPLDESGPLVEALEARGLGVVQLVTPVTTEARLGAACRASRGFVYAVTVTGITGGASDADGDLAAYLRRVASHAPVPVCAGFGVRSPEQVAQIAAHADGVIVGSALIEAQERGEDPARFIRWLAGIPG